MYKKEAIGFYPVTHQTHSFMGGAPYDNGEGYPKTDSGEPYDFIFQVHTGEAELHNHALGVIQFFTYPDELNGLDGYEPTTKTHVRFIPEEDYINLNEIELVPQYSNYTPVQEPEERIYYKPRKVLMSPFINSIEHAEAELESEYDEEELDEAYHNQSFEFYLNGYPDFTQVDFRENNDEYLAFFAGSISGKNIMWGDLGSASWWLPDDYLINQQDYSETTFYWDCA